jgi:hypothetical protein
MPIRKYLHDGSFDPETIQAMSTAFTTVLARLDELGRKLPKEAVAAFIVRLGGQGEQDAHRMTVLALNHFLEEKSERKQA